MSRKLDYLISGIAFLAFLYHCAYVLYPIDSTNQFLNTHLAFILILIFLGAARKTNGMHRIIIILLVILSVLVTGYVRFSLSRLEMALNINPVDFFMAVLLIVLVIESCRRVMGFVIPITVLIFLSYLFIGPYLPPGPFRTAHIDTIDIIHMLTFQFSGAGIYGTLLEVSAYYVLLFAVMGTLIQITGAPLIFISFGSLLGKKFRGGPALMAVSGSALMGTITGIATANIIVTGSFTIPLMKKVGFSPKEAAAIEGVASNGGQIMPPVLGSTAFVISMITGISYATIMIASLIPAILYYLTLALYVQLLAMKNNVMPMDAFVEKPNMRLTLLSAPGFFVPLGTITYLFLRGFSGMYVSFFAVVSALVMSFLRPGKRLSWNELSEGITNGIMSGVSVGATLAAMGILVKVLTVTGLGIKLPGIVETLSHGNIGIALLITSITCLILGMGIPTTPAYILVALTAAPVLLNMGVGLLPAHLFVFYFAVMALITPPVASAAVVSSQLAGASYFSTAIQCVKMGLTGLLVPFIFIFNPIFLMQPGENLFSGLLALLAVSVMLISLTLAFANYYFVSINYLERVLLTIGGIICFVYIIFFQNHFFLIVSIILLLLVTMNQLKKRRFLRAAIS